MLRQRGPERCIQLNTFTRAWRASIALMSVGTRNGDAPAREVLLVASSGGHLLQLKQQADLWPRERRHWVTFQKSDAISLLAGERTTWAHHPTNRNIPNLVRNLGLALRVVRRRRVQAIVTTGAGVAVPFAIVGRLLGVNVVYIESMARITSPSLTGRLVYPFADTFIVQWPELRRFYKHVRCMGTVFDPR
jgi:hypothetical protein